MSTALLLSGGMDSAAIAYWKRPSIAVTIDYGQRPASSEIAAARWLCQELDIEHYVIRANVSALGAGDLAGQPPSALNPWPEWWPYRNQYLVTVAAMFAIGRNVQRLFIGTVATDTRHVDGQPRFISAMDAVLALQEGAIRLEAPAMGCTTLELISNSKIPPELLAGAFSCHTGDLPCGSCAGCQKQAAILHRLRESGYFCRG